MTNTSPKAILLIRNPTAGRRRRRLVAAVVRLVRAEGWTVEQVDTGAPGDARRLAETCDENRYSVIAVAGGDGTINEVVNGLAHRSNGSPKLAIVPLGTANVLAHELGLRASAAQVANTMIAGRELLVHPGEVDCGRHTEQAGHLADRPYDLSQRAVIDQHVVDGGDADVVIYIQCGRCVSLRVQVDHQDARAMLGQASGQIHGGGRLADAALLVGDGHDPAAGRPRPGLAAAAHLDSSLCGPANRGIRRIRRDVRDDYSVGFP